MAVQVSPGEGREEASGINQVTVVGFRLACAWNESLR
jgi:hypothetical protein